MQNNPNKKIIENFKALVELLKMEINLIYDNDVKTVNGYRIDAFERNCKYISKLNKKIESANDLKNVKGIGKGTISRIEEILKTGKLKEIDSIKKRIKKMYKKHILVEELSTVIGIGSITALRLIDEWNFKSLKELKQGVKNGTIQVNDKIKLGLKYEGKFEKSIKRKYITKIYENIKSKLKVNSIVCGSYRRGLLKSHDIDLLIWSDDLIEEKDVKNSDVLTKSIKKLKKANIITDDITSENVKTKYMGFCTYKSKLYRIDVRLIAKESLYTAIAYFTGSYETNIKMRNRAKKFAYKLNEYGLFNCMNKRVPVNSEEHLFNLLRMKYLEPYER